MKGDQAEELMKQMRGGKVRKEQGGERLQGWKKVRNVRERHAGKQ